MAEEPIILSPAATSRLKLLLPESKELFGHGDNSLPLGMNEDRAVLRPKLDDFELCAEMLPHPISKEYADENAEVNYDSLSEVAVSPTTIEQLGVRRNK